MNSKKYGMIFNTKNNNYYYDVMLIVMPVHSADEMWIIMTKDGENQLDGTQNK